MGRILSVQRTRKSSGERRTRRLLFMGVALGAMVLSGVAVAQSDPAPSGSATPTVQEVVVTAQKRQQSLKDVPAAVSVVSGKMRDELGVLTVQDLTDITPGLTYNTSQDRVFIRGVGRQTNTVGTDPGVALYNDGFYAATTLTANNPPLFTQRIEVLRGPQGTLYGRNSIGGAINVISPRPTDDFEAEVRAVYGNYDHSEVQAVVSGPINDNLRFQIGGALTDQTEGYFHNTAGGPEEGGVANDKYVEAQLDANLGSNLDVWVKYAISSLDERNRTSVLSAPYDTTDFFVGPLSPNPTYGSTVPNPGVTDAHAFNTDTPSRSRLRDNNLVVMNATLHLGWADLKYVGGFQDYIYNLTQDYDNSSVRSYAYHPVGAPAPINIYPTEISYYTENRTYYSHELNLVSTGSGALQWLFGLYYYHENYDQPFSVADPNQPELRTPLTTLGAPAAPNPSGDYYYAYGKVQTDSYAAFGQVDYKLSGHFKITGGLRYSFDSKNAFEQSRSFLYNPSLPYGVGWYCASLTSCSGIAYQVTDGSRSLSHSWGNWSGTLGLEWTPSRDTLGYLKYSRGYKSGGFNLGALSPTPQVGSETNDTYELGLKQSFGRQLQANAAVFYYDYQNMQVPLLVAQGQGEPPLSDLINLDRSTATGFELEGTWAATHQLNFYLSYAYLDAKIAKACCYVDPLDPSAVAPGAKPAGPANSLGYQPQDLSGNALPYSPANKVALSTTYRFDFSPGSLLLAGTYAWRDETTSGVFDRSYYRAPAYDQLDLRVTWTDVKNRFSVIGYGRNVLNNVGYDGVNPTAVASGVVPSYSLTPPRTYGVELQVRY
jgi:iron complex outermembrane receptor protein